MHPSALLTVVVLCCPPPDGAEPKLLPAPKARKGIAARYPRDRGIGRDPRVVLHEPFERDDLKRRWTSIKQRPGQLDFTSKKNEVHSGRRALAVAYTPGKNTGGHLYTTLKPGHERLHLRFYVKFPRGHGYVHHFVHLTGYNPGTPWPQGGAGQRPTGNERFSSGIDVFGDWGRTPPPGRWGFYSYWCEMKGSPDGHYWGNEPKGGRQVGVETGRWICVEVMLQCNRVGQADGQQAFWIDGKLAGRWGGYRWRKDPALKVNGVWLLYYITRDAVKRSRGTSKAERVLFDDVVVATEYVGPMRGKKKKKR